MSTKERIWFEDPSWFLSRDNITRFLPERHSTLTQKLNACMRFALYFCTVAYCIRRDVRIWFLLLGAAALTAMMYNVDCAATQERDGALEAMNVGTTVAGDSCMLPTRDNPFMNVTLDDYTRMPNRPPACPLDGNPETTAEVERLFAHNLFRDVGDLHTNAPSRQFYTMPNSTIPNDQTSFANWLYKTDGPTCKESGGIACQSGLLHLYPTH